MKLLPLTKTEQVAALIAASLWVVALAVLFFNLPESNLRAPDVPAVSRIGDPKTATSTPAVKPTQVVYTATPKRSPKKRPKTAPGATRRATSTVVPRLSQSASRTTSPTPTSSVSPSPTISSEPATEPTPTSSTQERQEDRADR